jgi:hypothetical protein
LGGSSRFLTGLSDRFGMTKILLSFQASSTKIRFGRLQWSFAQAGCDGGYSQSLASSLKVLSFRIGPEAR